MRRYNIQVVVRPRYPLLDGSGESLVKCDVTSCCEMHARRYVLGRAYDDGYDVSFFRQIKAKEIQA
jgi:hypothetical protein